MAEVPPDLHYTEEHEYLKPTDDEGVYLIGITDYAQSELGDIVYVELPSPGERFDRMDVFGTVEAVKAVSDLFCPVSGEVVEVNTALDRDPGMVNNDPYGDGWMLKLRVTSPDEVGALLSAEAYAEQIGDAG